MRFHEDRCSSGYSHSDSAVLSPRDSATSMRVHEAGGVSRAAACGGEYKSGNLSVAKLFFIYGYSILSLFYNVRVYEIIYHTMIFINIIFIYISVYLF